MLDVQAIAEPAEPLVLLGFAAQLGPLGKPEPQVKVQQAPPGFAVPLELQERSAVLFRSAHSLTWK